MGPRLLAGAAALALVLASTAQAPAQAQAPSPAVKAALADPARAADASHDAARKPAETLAFAGVKPGMKVGDFIMGGGYYTRILSRVVGPKGHVWAYQPAEFIKFRPAYGEEQKTTVAGLPNATAVSSPLGELGFPEPLDLIFTAQNYHDLHLKVMPPETTAKVNGALYRSLKPGGVLVVIDHVADAGVADAPDRLHRIDPAVMRREIEAAGFRFDGESPILRAPADPHTALVFGPDIRGKTDQVLFRFRKPK